MFKKKPTIKTLAPLRSSDRRKIADQIIQEYKVPVTASSPAPAAEGDENAPTKPASNIAAVRDALLPDDTQTGRFTTTAGPDLRPVQGTIYAGSHPGCGERILWYKLEQGPGSDGRVYPTVYTLWHNPGLVPLLHTPNLVMDKLYGGADLMTPGLANGPPFPAAAVQNAVVAVASLNKPSVPTFVGVCEINVAGLTRVLGEKGHAVRGLQWVGDELWNWSSKQSGGQASPESLEGWLGGIHDVEQDLDELSLAGKVREGDEEGGVSLEDQPGVHAQEDVKEPTTKEIDQAFIKAFLYALYQYKKDNPSQQNHGLSLPIQPSFLTSNLLTPFLPIHSPQLAQYYQIKKTSWKNVKKFIKYLDKEELVKSKDRSGNETVILDVDFEDLRVVNFVPFKLPKKSKPENAKTGTANGNGSSAEQAFNIRTLYRPSGKLVPEVFEPLSNNDPNNYYSATDVSKHLNDYLESQQPPIISPSNPRIINLNPYISNKILSSNKPSDLAILSRGTVQRDVLHRRILEDPTLCAPFHAIIKPGQTLKDTKMKAGALPKVSVMIERRTGNKLVTRITGLETFTVSPHTLGDELQKKCASSTSVTQATGGAKGLMEVLVQGDHRRTVESLLGSKGVKSQWVDVVDKSQKKGGGGR